MKNSVAIFSNAISFFNRSYPVKKGEKASISIPFRKDKIADVLYTLRLFGEVSVLSQSFLPTNANDSKLEVDSSNMLQSLVTQLGGAAVKIKRNDGGDVEGKVVGIDTFINDHGTYQSEVRTLGIMTKTGMQIVPVSEIRLLDFTEQEIRAEIDRALSKKKQSIKPDSTFFDITLASEKDTEAVVQYAIQTAAWTPSYRISQEKGIFNLEGYAVVHNNTDEDWNEFIISVVVGDPHTFKADIDQQKTPGRNLVNFVRAQAAGGVEVDSGVADDAYSLQQMAAGSAGLESVGGGFEMARARSRPMAASFSAAPPPPRASVGAAQAEEVGDFSLWTAMNEVSIPANRSALVPLFDVGLKNAKVVLYYKNGKRPMRAVQFKNDTDWSLGYGPCSVFNNNTNEGSCSFMPCKPGEDRLLIHAQENGVQVQLSEKENINERTSIVFDNGVATSHYVSRVVSEYTYKNNKKESFTLLMDYDKQVSGEIEFDNATVTETLDHGKRAKVDLKPNASTKVTVTETHQSKQSITISGGWMQQTFIQSTGKLRMTPEIQQCLTLQEQIGKITTEIQAQKNRISTLEKDQGRIRENLKAVQSGEDAVEWRQKLSASEREIDAISNTKVPELEKQQKTTQEQLNEALKKLTLTYKG